MASSKTGGAGPEPTKGHHQDDMNERSARANVCSGTSLESIDISGEFGSSRKDTHWGRLKLKRDQQ